MNWGTRLAAAGMCLLLTTSIQLLGSSAPDTGHGEKPKGEDHATVSEKEPATAYSSPFIYSTDPNSEAYRRMVENLHRQASLSARTRNVKVAENLYLRLLNLEISDDVRNEALLELAVLYDQEGDEGKLTAIYEKFIEEFPDDPKLGSIYMKLGHLYREMGAFHMAIAKFYSVLNATLSIKGEDIETYRRMALKAQLEIAETYFLTGDYENAARFYDRLSRLDLTRKDRSQVEFKLAYTKYLMGDYASVIASLNRFIERFPDSPLVPESRYLLAVSHKRLEHPREALHEVLALLKAEQDKNGKNSELWLYWKNRTGNQLANSFYEQSDYNRALKIYQAMAPLSDTPEWQWPVIYQIGVCYEQLNRPDAARKAYEYILQSADEEKAKGMVVAENATLLSIVESTEWRMDNLEWFKKTRNQVNELLEEILASSDKMGNHEDGVDTETSPNPL